MCGREREEARVTHGTQEHTRYVGTTDNGIRGRRYRKRNCYGRQKEGKKVCEGIHKAWWWRKDHTEFFPSSSSRDKGQMDDIDDIDLPVCR